MLTVLVYSSSPAVRERVLVALGHTPDQELGRLSYVIAADAKAVVAAVDAGGIDLCVLDGEAWPVGGMGLARQLKDEIADAPATVLLIARRDDSWLATWSRADAVVSHPVDPFALTDAVVGLLKVRAARGPVAAVEPTRGRFGLRRA